VLGYINDTVRVSTSLDRGPAPTLSGTAKSMVSDGPE